MISRAQIAESLVWILALLIFLVVGALLWVTVQSSRPPRWISVQGPDTVAASNHATIQVHLRAGVEPGYLSLDLHWMEPGRKSRGFLSRAVPQVVSNAEATYTFEALVSPRPGLAFVFAVIWLSQTGQWQPDTPTIWTEPIPVRAKDGSESSTQQRRLPIFEQESWRPLPPMSRSARGLTAAAWLSAAAISALATCARWKRQERGGRWATLWLAPLGCALAGLWELLSADAVLANWFREWAVAQRSYQGRQVYQLAASAALAVGLAFAGIQSIRLRLTSLIRAVMLGGALYVSLASVVVVSLHAADRLASLTWGTIPALQWLKLVSASAVLGAVALHVCPAGKSPDQPKHV